MRRRSLLVAAGWLGAAVLALLVGLGAISVIGAGLTGDSTPALSAADVDKQLREQPSTSAALGENPSPGAGPSATAARPSPTKEPAGPASPAVKRTRGGTVVARCVGAGAEIVTMTAAIGFNVHEKQGAEGEFRSSSDNHDRVKIRVSCAGGSPSISVENRS
jgi:hypothetical protein